MAHRLERVSVSVERSRFRFRTVRIRGYRRPMGEPTVRALTSETWPDFAAIWERKSGLFSGCWCVHFHPDDELPGESNRDFKERMVAEGVAHAALVYVD